MKMQSVRNTGPERAPEKSYLCARLCDTSSFFCKTKTYYDYKANIPCVNVHGRKRRGEEGKRSSLLH